MSRRPLPERGPLTSWLLTRIGDQLEEAGQLLGDGVAPPEGGWTQGQPGQGDFIAYSVLMGGAATAGQPQTLGGSVDSDGWMLRYTLRSVGAVREQADWAGDAVRAAWHGLESTTMLLGPAKWQVHVPAVTSMGQPVRNDAVQPPLWEVTDEVSLRLDRSRA